MVGPGALPLNPQASMVLSGWIFCFSTSATRWKTLVPPSIVQARSPTSVVTTGTGDAGEGLAGRGIWALGEAAGGGGSAGFGIGMGIFMVCADRPRTAKRAAPDAKARWRKVRRLLIRTPGGSTAGGRREECETLPLPDEAGDASI